MPFYDSNDEPLLTIPLTQAPFLGQTFQLRSELRFREFDAPEDPLANPNHVAEPHHPDPDPEYGNRTDLASVPAFLWGFIASYGRQTAPALVHDHSAYQIELGDPPAPLRRFDGALAQRREADRIFRVGLRQVNVGLLRAYLIWASVGAQRYWVHARGLAVLLIAQLLVAVGLSTTAVVLSFTASPWWMLLLAIPAILALPWRADAPMVLMQSVGVVLVWPLVLIQVVILLVFEAVEVVVRELIDRPFIDPRPATDLGPRSHPTSPELGRLLPGGAVNSRSGRSRRRIRRYPPPPPQNPGT